MSKTRVRIHLAWLLCLLAGSAAAADPYDGVYAALQDGIEYRLTLEADNFGRYDGIFSVNGEKLGLEATRFGERLAGRTLGPDGFTPVLLVLRARNLLLLSYQDGRTLRLLRVHE